MLFFLIVLWQRLKTELNVGENFLDFLEDKFPLLKSTDKKNLKNKIEEIYFSKKFL